LTELLTGEPVSVIQKNLRRQRMLRRRRRVYLGLAVTALIVVGVLFSPIGPFSSLLFPQAGAVSQGGQITPQQPEHNAQAAAAAGSSPVEKKSDSTEPTIAIVVDDTGAAAQNLDKWLEIDAPLTFSVLPFYSATKDLAETLYQAGYRIMMHIPTENDPPHSFSGNGQLATAMDRATVFNTLDGDLADIPHVTGINNHQGGKGCNDLALMTHECEWAQQNGLFVVDSDSSTASKVTKAAASLGMPRRLNQLFIDHQNEADYIRKAMRQLADIARRNGTAIGICHFHRPNTPTIVGEMIQTLRSEGIHFAFVQDVED
jgi:polysaccharide deacetylase 2 family uncharacterized protein YibQ